VLISWPHQVGPGRFSYPFSAGAFTVAQVFFAMQHLAMLPLFAALLLLERRTPSRAVRVGTWIALVGQLVLTGCELFAITARDASSSSSVGTAAGTAYGPAMVLLGVGLVVAGIGARRVRLLVGAGRWLVLPLGVYVFAVLMPGVFGPMVVGRIVIGLWMLGFAVLGLVLARESRP
jgi:hypothetical protein